jgi:threonine/homoserine/homoserine lactone efflux protein
MVFAVGVGLGSVLERVPELYTALRVLCGAYVLWLAFKIARSRSLGTSENNKISVPIGFLQAAMFQLVNPMAWVVALIVTVSYTVPEQFMTSLILMIAIFAIVNIPSISVWALSGAALRQTLAKGRRIVLFNMAMALLLVGSMIPVLLRG